MFRVGQRVRCIRAGNCCACPRPCLVQGREYVVSAVGFFIFRDIPMVDVEGVVAHDPMAWQADRFQSETNISVFAEMVNSKQLV